MPDTIKISELDEALAIADAAEFPYTQENGGELTTFKAPLTQIAAKVVEDMSYAGINLPVGAGVKSVENTLNYLLGAVGGNPNENIATEYDPTDTYAKGDYCIYENVLYICTDSDGTTGTFDPTAWSQTELAEHTAENAANIGDLTSLTTTDKSSLVGAVNEVNKHLTYDLISTFTANNDTWNATVDGTLIVTATASTTTASYVYLNGLSRTLGSIVCPNGAGGYNYGFSVPCIKGQTYKLLMGGFTSATVLVVYGTTN